MPEEKKESKALTAAVEAVKLTLMLSTGTLVFSAGLLKEGVNSSCLAKWCLVVSWCLFGVSIISGALAYLRVPIMINEGKPDIRDKWFESPGRVHHLAFLGGVISLGIAMIAILFSK